MKHCPKCRVESRSDADWCWHCGYSYEDAQEKEAQALDAQAEREANRKDGDTRE